MSQDALNPEVLQTVARSLKLIELGIGAALALTLVKFVLTWVAKYKKSVDEEHRRDLEDSSRVANRLEKTKGHPACVETERIILMSDGVARLQIGQNDLKMSIAETTKVQVTHTTLLKEIAVSNRNQELILGQLLALFVPVPKPKTAREAPEGDDS